MSNGLPRINVRISEEKRADGLWAAAVLDTTVSDRLREAHDALVAEAERVSGQVRPSARPGSQPE